MVGRCADVARAMWDRLIFELGDRYTGMYHKLDVD